MQPGQKMALLRAWWCHQPSLKHRPVLLQQKGKVEPCRLRVCRLFSGSSDLSSRGFCRELTGGLGGALPAVITKPTPTHRLCILHVHEGIYSTWTHIPAERA